VARLQGALFWELRTALSLSHLKMQQDRKDDARQLLIDVCGKFTEGFEIADFRAAQTMLGELRSGRG
jgi:predicted ATPase